MILLDGSSLTLDQLMAIADRGEPVGLAPDAVTQVRAARAVIDRAAEGAAPVYGVNTGFGSFADVRIAPAALEALQLNLLRSHAAGVGEPLSIRAVRATMALRANVLAKGSRGFGWRRSNAATDNPMVFADSGDIVSGGNFHGAPIAIAADLAATALTPLATISERRTDRLMNPVVSGLPAFLTREGGLRSGLMLAQVTAAAGASELKTLAYPAAVNSIPTSAGQEDHVSMSMAAALKAGRSLTRAREVVAVELLCACQAIDLLAPLTTSPALAAVHACVRSRVPPLDDDRSPAPDIAAITELIATGELENSCGVLVK